MKEFLEILGWKKLLIVLFSLLILRVSLTIPFCQTFLHPLVINSTWYIMFCGGLIFIFAANNVCEKFFDSKFELMRETKQITIKIKDYPDINRLQKTYIALAGIGLISVMYVCIMFETWLALILSIVLSVLGYFYASNAKRKYLIGNLTLAVSYSLMLLIPLSLDFLPIASDVYRVLGGNSLLGMKEGIDALYFSLLWLVCLIFMLSFLWDVVGDMANIDYDKQRSINTMAVVEGEKKTKRIVLILAIIVMLLVCLFSYSARNYIEITQLIIGIVLVFIPICYFLFMLTKAKQNTDYDFLYTLLGMTYISLLFILSFLKYFFVNGAIAFPVQ